MKLKKIGGAIHLEEVTIELTDTERDFISSFDVSRVMMAAAGLLDEASSEDRAQLAVQNLRLAAPIWSSIRSKIVTAITQKAVGGVMEFNREEFEERIDEAYRLAQGHKTTYVYLEHVRARFPKLTDEQFCELFMQYIKGLPEENRYLADASSPIGITVFHCPQAYAFSILRRKR